MDLDLIERITTFTEDFADAFTEGENDSELTPYLISLPLEGAIAHTFRCKAKVTWGDFLMDDDALLKIQDESLREKITQGGKVVEHCWIQLDDDYIIDPLAGQLSKLYGFASLGDIYVGKKPEWYPTTPKTTV